MTAEPLRGSKGENSVSFKLEPIASLAPVEALWRTLEERSNISFFLSWTWVGTWLGCLPEHVQPQLLTATGTDEAIGAAILIARRQRRHGIVDVRQMHFNSTGDPALDCIWIEHNGFVARDDARDALWPAFLRWFAQQAAAEELVIPRAAEELMDHVAGDARLLHTTVSSPAFLSVLAPGGVDAILDRLSRNARQQMRRSLRACEVLGELRCEVADSVGTALAWFDALKAFHVRSWTRRGEPHAFQRPFTEKFLRALIERGVPERSLVLLRVSADSVPLGYLCNFRRGHRVFAYQSGFDDSLARLRPGYVSHLLAMAACAGEGASEYDFMAGDNRLKRTLGEQRYTMYAHGFAQPKLRLKLEAAARHLAQSIGVGTKKRKRPA